MALVSDAATTEEEKRTAALAAVQAIQKYGYAVVAGAATYPRGEPVVIPDALRATIKARARPVGARPAVTEGRSFFITEPLVKISTHETFVRYKTEKGEYLDVPFTQLLSSYGPVIVTLWWARKMSLPDLLRGEER
jgi:hypothetical protein